MLTLSTSLPSQVPSEWSTRVCMMVKCQKPWGRTLSTSKCCPVWQYFMVMFNNNHRAILQRVVRMFIFMWRNILFSMHQQALSSTWFGYESERALFYRSSMDTPSWSDTTNWELETELNVHIRWILKEKPYTTILQLGVQIILNSKDCDC